MNWNLVDQFMSNLNYIDRIEGVISTWKNGNWRVAYQRYGASGVIRVMWGAFTMQDAPVFTAQRYTWTGIETERLLKRHGIKLWDRALTNEGTEIQFRVKARQAKWTEYVLLRAGVPVTTNLREKRNQMWAAKYKGVEPAARRKKWRL